MEVEKTDEEGGVMAEEVSDPVFPPTIFLPNWPSYSCFSACAELCVRSFAVASERPPSHLNFG